MYKVAKPAIELWLQERRSGRVMMLRVKLMTVSNYYGKVISFALFCNEMVHSYKTEKNTPFFQTSLKEN